jgi:hypothetical protein
MDALPTKVDRPTPLMLNKSGYGVVTARFVSIDPFSEMAIKPAQSAHEKFIFENGGERRRGTGALGRICVIARPADNTSMAGGVDSVKAGDRMTATCRAKCLLPVMCKILNKR